MITGKIGRTGVVVSIGDTGKHKGYYNMETGEVVISSKIKSERKRYEVLLHELIHACETACINKGYIKRRMGENYVENISANLALLLVEGGYLNLIQKEEE